MMKTTLKNILLILSATISLLSPSIAQAQSQVQAPNTKTAETCFEAYYGTKIYASANANKSFNFVISIPVLATDFSLRLYRSGKMLPAQYRIETREKLEKTMSVLFKKEFDFGQDSYADSLKAQTQSQVSQQFSAYRKHIEKCDVSFDIPYIIKSKAWENPLTDKDCIINYVTLQASTRAQAEQKYFNERSVFAAHIDEIVMERKADVEEQIFKSAQAQGLQIAQKSFNRDGTPDFGEIIESHEWVQKCDAKYGLTITEIPQALYSAAAGK